jgi:CMP-2-keto-3-deoxyoctulosonic acid synthetase
MGLEQWLGRWASGLINQTQLFQVLEQLEQLDLPYEIDLSIYSQIENVDLLEDIKRAGKVIEHRQECC